MMQVTSPFRDGKEITTGSSDCIRKLRETIIFYLKSWKQHLIWNFVMATYDMIWNKDFDLSANLM